MAKKIGHVTSPLHRGKAPAWLFERMKMLSRYIVLAMREALPPHRVIEKFSDPYWFQCLGCLLGFDWHSSGLTTTVCGALKEGIKGIEKETGIFIAGGKGKAGRKTPEEIKLWCEATGAPAEKLIYASKMSAKVDSSCIQDGYQIYHHTFIFTSDGMWVTVQQGMNDKNATARRYHWLGEKIKEFVCEPHRAIESDRIEQKVLNLVAAQSEDCRKASVEIATQKPSKIFTEAVVKLPERHNIILSDINPAKVEKILLKTYANPPDSFEKLVATPGVGAKSLRALALLSELLYGKSPSFKDPARYSYAHGGKDGTPYPVERKVYDSTIEALKRAVMNSRLGRREKIESLNKLARFYET